VDIFSAMWFNIVSEKATRCLEINTEWHHCNTKVKYLAYGDIVVKFVWSVFAIEEVLSHLKGESRVD
jgi:hypothetical protein